ncbi:MAG: DNA glycosylase AlkZ-like family protein [Acetobacteraceae bacterium]
MPKKLTLAHLRRMAIAASFRTPTTLGRAIRGMGFVQADPIRAPARAQDLILRHRVADYRAGDVHRQFARLRLEEDFFYAYGLMPQATWNLLQPRHDAESHDGRHRPVGLAADVLAFVQEHGAAHPRDLAEHYGRERALNGWGSWSAATTRALQHLHYHGLLRVAQRRDGIRVYAPAAPHAEPLPRDERRRRAVLLLARILAPLPERSLRPACALLARGVPDLGDPGQIVRALLTSGELEAGEVEGERYLWPAKLRATGQPRVVRLLAPFDPLVWDRRRFALLWGWDYRFEAYTPAAERRLGYYALPLLWGEHVIGWANASVANGGFQVTPGFVGAAPFDRAFRRAWDVEIERFAAFLQPDANG